MDRNKQYFPEPHEVQPHAMAFVRMMFAHAKFEREVRTLQGVITGKPDFGERRCNQWGASDRPEKMANLIRDFDRLGDVPEIDSIRKILKEAIDPCLARNTLAHGEWRSFDPATSVISVRSGTARTKDVRDMHSDWTADAIGKVADKLHDLEIELFKLRRTIEDRVASPDVA